MAPKKRKIGSKGATPPSLPLKPRKFITQEVEENFNTLNVKLFVPERGFPKNNPNFPFFLYNRKHWKKLCKRPNLRVALVMH